MRNPQQPGRLRSHHPGNAEQRRITTKSPTNITNFLLSYVSDPSALDRMRMGPWVLAFLAFLTVIFYLLKKEYWRDIH